MNGKMIWSSIIAIAFLAGMAWGMFQGFCFADDRWNQAPGLKQALEESAVRTKATNMIMTKMLIKDTLKEIAELEAIYKNPHTGEIVITDPKDSAEHKRLLLDLEGFQTDLKLLKERK